MRRHAVLLLAGISVPVWAGDGDINVRFATRARVEAVDGQFRPASSAAEHDLAMLFRTELAAEYDAGKVRIGGEIIDSRVYFERGRSSVGPNEVNALEPVQAYAMLDLPSVQVTAGRFTMFLGSRRFVTRNGFRNTVNGFTGVKAALGDEKLGGTLFWTVTQARLPSDREGVRDNAVELDRERGSPRFLGAFVQRRVGPVGVEGYLYRLAEHDARGIATRDRRLWTLGGRAMRAPAVGAFDWEVEGAWQWGETHASIAAADVTRLPVRAGFLHASVGRSLPGTWKPRAQLAFDFGTGDGRGRTYRRFDTLFGGRAWEFGPTSLYGAVQRSNLMSFDARVETRPDAATDGWLAVRPMWLASRTDAFAATEVRDTAGESGRYAGTQVELRVRRWLRKDKLRLGAGAVYLAKGRFLRTAPNAPRDGDTRYGFVELAFTL